MPKKTDLEIAVEGAMLKALKKHFPKIEIRRWSNESYILAQERKVGNFTYTNTPSFKISIHGNQISAEVSFFTYTDDLNKPTTDLEKWLSNLVASVAKMMKDDGRRVKKASK